MQIEFLAHASFLMTNEAGIRFMTDPYESGSFSGRVGYAPIDVAPDVVIITHDHKDHSHTETLPGDFQVVRHQDLIHDVPVRSVQAFHDMEQGTRFGGVIDMKIFTIDGITFLHCGDIGELLDDTDKLAAIGEIDVLIIPTGGFYTLGPDGAAEVTEKLKPRYVIPCHYKTVDCGFDIEPVEPFLSHFEKVVQVKNSCFELKEQDLPEETTVLVLEMRYCR